MMPDSEITRVLGMLEYRRPQRSRTEKAFILRYLDTVPGMYADAYGNRILPSPGSKVLISCHTDSVHTSPGKQKIELSGNGIVSLSKLESVSNCLGADDAAGIYAALRMAEAGVNATFVFHRDEEHGGLGSEWLASYYGDWLSTFDACLALDRRGTQDVIVTQRWDTCASHDFAYGLAEQLDMGHRPADGIFTDSANYTDIIPECSNLSVGYNHEHTRKETMNLHYLEAVIRRLIAVDWNALPIFRVPGSGSTVMGDYMFDAAWDGGLLQKHKA